MGSWMISELTEPNDCSSSLERARRRVNVTLALVCLGLGGGVMIALILSGPKPPERAAQARPPAVATAAILPGIEASPVIGFGTVSPKHQVDIIPQVNGKLVYVHEDLAQGKIITKGELLFRIDRTIYGSRVAQAQAEERRLEGVLARQNTELAALDERIANAERMLEIVQGEYLKTKELFENENVGTLQDVTADEQRYLRQKDAVAELRSRREIIPHLKAETQATLDAARARLGQAEIELANTEILCPFDARVESVGAYTSQVVTAYFAIARLTSLEAFEISVGIDPRELRWLDESAQPAALRQGDGVSRAEVVVRSTLRGVDYEWRGYVTRFERMDEATRTAQMVVEVQEADMFAQGAGTDDGEGLSLAMGMFCRTELPARPLEEALLVPRHAIHDNKWVYVFEADDAADDPSIGRLARRQVPMLRSVRDSVLVDYRGRSSERICELEAGEQVVVSPLLKPVVGMPVRLRDEQMAAVDKPAATTGLRDDADSLLNSTSSLLASTGSLAGTR
jgi:multidrug efflux pump subunit AcrA (membrane-fusion protein)